MPQLTEDSEFSQRPFGERYVLECVLYLFDSDVLIRLLVLGCTNDAIGSLTDRLEHRVALRDLEFGAMDHVAAGVESET
eukprot:CAMPEP_0170626000 /NCGR_PEP_ID=MMETSP0224-20130122/31096_1 /TAXON_ID=285029 /ORGANISM="Togula jolla, Strain CCCM 725" /LENGTH=78 /DNA_ID=CAMNT_0010952687 /DNA_START=1002 /DNA_END=1234 /DNA_ORIENTATION=+